MAKPKGNRSAEISAHKHKDKRANIPTEELRDFVEDDEKAPKTILYPRDPSLDPQLVWKGKDEQDREALAVPAVPIYIQEKIHPQALIEDLRRNPPVPPHPGPTAIELRNLMQIFSLLNVQSKYNDYSQWGCALFCKAFLLLSSILFKRCVANWAMWTSAYAIACARRISPANGN